MDFSSEFDFGPERMPARNAFGIHSEAALAVSLQEDCTASELQVRMGLLCAFALRKLHSYATLRHLHVIF
jgi:hypothetical protein